MLLHQPTIMLLLGGVAVLNCIILMWAGSLGASRRTAVCFAAGSLLLTLPAWAMQPDSGLSEELRVFLFNVPAIGSHLLWLFGAKLLFDQPLHLVKWLLLAAVFIIALTWLTYLHPDRDWRVFIACIGYMILRGTTAVVLFVHAGRVDRLLAGLLGMLMAAEAVIFLNRALAGLAGLVPAINAVAFSEQIPAWVFLLITSVISAPLLLLLLLSRNLNDLKQLSARLSGTLQAMPDLVFELDKEGRYRAFHTHHSNLLAVPPAVFLGQRPEDVLPADIVKVQRAAIAEVNRSGRAEGFEYSLELPDGKHWFETCAAALGERETSSHKADGYVFVIRDISERKRSEHLKQQLISVFSHELRTPLTAIRGALDTLASGVLANQPQRTQLIVRNARHSERQLAALIDDLLDMQDLTTGVLILDRRCTPIRALLSNAVQSRAAEANAREIELHIAAPLPSTAVFVDNNRFVQIMDKLLANAITAAPLRSTIMISTVVVADRIRIAVLDQGPGVPEHLVPLLFEPFSIADGSTTRSSCGAGMGLAIVRKLLEHMDGSIRYSKAAGNGALFTIELPVCADPDQTS